MKRTIRQPFAVATLAWLVVFWGAGFAPAEEGGASAPQDDMALQLGDIVVTATRSEREVADVPASVTVIGAEDIERIGASSVVDALAKLGGVHVTSTSGHMVQSWISLRGFGDNSGLRTLVLVDGHKLNRPDMGGINWLQVPLSIVERIEIVRGGNSALYGNHAVGGVINIITRKQAAGGDGGRPTVRFDAGVGSYNTSDLRLSCMGSSGPLGYVVSTERNASLGYRERSAYRTESGSVDVSYDVNATFSARLGMSFLTTDYEFPGTLTRSQIDADPRQSVMLRDEGAGDYWTFSAGGDLDLGAGGRISLDTSWRTRDLAWDLGGTYVDNVLGTLAFTPKYMVDTQAAGRACRLTFGVDIYRDTLGLDRYRDRERTILLADVDLCRTSLGGYSHAEVDITDSLTLSGAIRAERSETDAESRDAVSASHSYDEETVFRESAFNAGLLYRATESWRFFARFDTLYRYPTMDEIADYQGFYSQVPFNRDLEPETGTSVELGSRLNVSPTLELAATVFQLDMEDEISWDGSKNSNLDETCRRGIGLAANMRPFEWLTTGVRYGYTQAELASGASDGKDVPLVPREKLSAHLEVALPGDVSVRTDAAYTSSMYQGSGDFAYSLPELPGHTIWGASVNYRPTRFEDRLSAFVVVDNLFDKQYVSTGYYGGLYAASGRTFRTGISLTY